MSADFVLDKFGGLSGLIAVRADGRFRRVSPIAVRLGKGLLTEPIAGA